MSNLGVRPSYATGFAQWPGMSEYPQLWEGLVGAWDMSLGMTGNKVFDLSGNGQTGTFVGNTAWSTGKFGPCLTFDDNDTVTIGKYLWNFNSGYTISFWIKIDTKPVGNWESDYVCQFKTDASNLINIACRRSNEETWQWRVDSNFNGTTKTASSAFSANPPGNGVWVHLVIRWDLVNLKTFADASEIATVAASSVSFGTLMGLTTIGRIVGFNGQIDNFQFYNRALTVSEIALLYQLKRRLG